MSEEVIRSKKSSRLNPVKQQKQQLEVDSSWRLGSVNIVVQYDDRQLQSPKVIRDYKVYFTIQGGLATKYLLEQLKKDKIIKEQSSLSFYDQNRDIFVYSLTIPPSLQTLSTDHNINKRFISKDMVIKMKVRNKKKIAIDALIQQQREKYDETEDDKNSKGQKQKKVGEVVEKVALWRKFYTGFHDEDGNYFQKPLESAAQQVGIAKKTLDDYLLQIRNGKKYGFNFNEKYNCKIGELRAFVRDEKKKAEQK